MDEIIDNQNNLRSIIINEDIDFINNKNQRIDTDINNNNNNNNYYIDNIISKAEQNRNIRSLIIDKNRNNYNYNNNINNIENCFSNTYNNGFNNYINHGNDIFYKKKEEKKFSNTLNINDLNKNEMLPSYRNYNNININNYNMYNSLINNNRINYNINQRNISQNNKFNNINDYNGNNKILMNKSSTNFFQKMPINLDEEDKNEVNNNYN